MAKDQKGPERNDKPLWITRRKRDYDKYCRYEKLLANSYKKDEVIVFFESTPTEKEINTVKESFRLDGFDPKMISIRRCDNCNIPVLLFQSKNIHTVVSSDGVRAGSGHASTTVGEHYSLNFFNRTPFDKKDGLQFRQQPGETAARKEKIVVAVLDTGFDQHLIDPAYLWQGTATNQDAECYKNVTTGWNFVNDTSDFNDDSLNHHGSIVSQYIINEFKKSSMNSVQIMPLKTHDKNGVGDLFGIICAIHFAIAKGANIINASWGFYYYFEEPIPYLKKLITKTLQDKGIVFVTAAGNKIPEEDVIAQQIYLSELGLHLTADELRDLAIHNFYPAHLSTNKNSVITATTTDGRTTVSPTQNYSNAFTDIGVLADKVTIDSMQFQVPFAGMTDMISGSSFATAIMTGIVGAHCEKNTYTPGVRNEDVIKHLISTGHANTEPALKKKYIKKGSWTKKG